MSDLLRVFEPVLVPFSRRLVPHHLAQPQPRQNIADARHAPADGPGDFAGSHLFIFCEELNDREGYWASKEPTET